MALCTKSAKCQTLPSNIADDEHFNEDENELEEKTAYIPPFNFMLNPIKMLTMNYPGSEISGFKITLGTPLS